MPQTLTLSWSADTEIMQREEGDPHLQGQVKIPLDARSGSGCKIQPQTILDLDVPFQRQINIRDCSAALNLCKTTFKKGDGLPR